MAEQYLGRLPMSLLDFKRSEELHKFIGDNGRDVSLPKSTGYAYEYNQQNNTVFSPDLTAYVYRFYLGDMLDAGMTPKVIDPFAGRTTRGMIAYLTGLEYVGFDIDERNVAESYDALSKVQSRFLDGKKRVMPTWVVKDSTTSFDYPSGHFDFAFTCPPYYDLEKYTNDPHDLANKKTYEEFLTEITKTWKEVYRVLHSDSFFVFVANYFHRDGKIIHLARDLVDIGTEAGFTYYDEIVSVLKGQRALRSLSSNFKHYYHAKTHEYIEVLLKE
ncbi:MAG: DNA methyltransferase [Candidatus Kryptoniota bacterium]